MSEIWKPIPSQPEFEASTEGRIRRRPDANHPNAGGILRGCSHNNGYHTTAEGGAASRSHSERHPCGSGARPAPPIWRLGMSAAARWGRAPVRELHMFGERVPA